MSRNMSTYKDIADILILHEGKRRKPYRCTKGKLTIGVGRNLESNGLRDTEIMYMLNNDIADCIRDLQDIFPDFDKVDDSVRDSVYDEVRDKV